MKKILSSVLCLFLCITLVGCISDDSSVAEKIFGLNEGATFNTLKFTAVEIKESNGNTFFSPEEGNVFVGIKFEIENISNEEQAVSSLLLFEGYADDVKCEFSFNAACVFDEGTLDGTLAPGKKLVGWYALEVSKSWQEIELNVKADLFSNSSAKFVFTK